ncbi:hypothetical protein AAHK20_31595 [Trinickia sp. YCB016]
MTKRGRFAIRQFPFLVGLARCIAQTALWLGLCECAAAQSVLAPGNPPPALPNALALAATNVGVKQCLPAIKALSALGVQGTANNDVLLDWDRKRSGNSSVFSLIGLEYGNGTAAMSVNAVPEADGSCSVAAERISVAPFACKSVADRELAGYRATPLLSHMTVYTDAKDPGSSVSLIDAPPACLVIRRYVKFSSKPPAPGQPAPAK